jgi:ketosteroid isomerase-like protein
MVDESKREDAATAMRQINQAWLEGRVEDLAPMAHPEIVMVFPGFAGRIQGREGFLAGFRDFRQNATIQEFREHDLQVDVAGDTAVITFRYDMIYERSGKRYRATGRDLWVFQREGGAWIAVWRAMLDMEENDA